MGVVLSCKTDMMIGVTLLLLRCLARSANDCRCSMSWILNWRPQDCSNARIWNWRFPAFVRMDTNVWSHCGIQEQTSVIASKQRPRKLTILGSDGRCYHFLLKGHEDLRQDQRVMQLFGLVNTLLDSDSETQKRHVGIETISVVPLSQNTGSDQLAPSLRHDAFLDQGVQGE